MAYQRGTKASYQLWADLVDDQSYIFENFLPYFEKSLHFTPANIELRGANATVEYDPTVLGNGEGPLSVTYPHYAQAFATWARGAFVEIGIEATNGFQSGELLGQSYGLYTINATTMHRESSETSFLRRALAYPNFLVFQHTMANKILFDDSKKAIAVLTDTQGYAFTLSARKEIILSAGAFQSPQLLMVSGVGPAATLQEYGIPIIADRPGVGQNMQDHVIYAPSYRVNVITQSALLDASFEAQANKEYNERAAGIYANPTSDVLAWEKIPEPLRSTLSNDTISILAEYPTDWPEVEYLSMGGYFGYQRNYIRDNPSDGYNYASLAISLCTPRSRGNISISSSSASVQPVINPNWLTHPADIEIAIAAFKRAREFFNTSAIEPILIGPEYFPGTDVSTDAEIEAHIRKSFDTIFHASCTCAMGKVDDEQAVIDSRARVIGVQALRVVDASSLPLLPPGHPQSTICKFPYILLEI